MINAVNIQKNNNLSFGRRKIPRFLYHITTNDHWEKIKKSGKLCQTKDAYVGTGVFMIDLKNFFANWHKFGLEYLSRLKEFEPGKIFPDFDKNLHEFLLEHVKKDKSGLVILRIKSDSLPQKGKLLIRDQANVISSPFTENVKAAQVYNAENTRKYIRKKAIEYIYQGGDIPITNIEKIGGDPLIENESLWTKFKKFLAPEEPLTTRWEKWL